MYLLLSYRAHQMLMPFINFLKHRINLEMLLGVLPRVALLAQRCPSTFDHIADVVKFSFTIKELVSFFASIKVQCQVLKMLWG